MIIANRLTQLLFLIGISILILTINSCSFEEKSQESNNSENSKMPTEQQLAILDAGNFVELSDLKVKRIKSLLNDLSLMYNEQTDSIAEITSQVQGVLFDKGIKISNLTILTDIRNGGKVEGVKYKDAAVLYGVLTDRNQ